MHVSIISLRFKLSEYNRFIMSSTSIFVVEAFLKGTKAYTGNPAGVVFLEYDNDIPDDTKQKITSTSYLPTMAFVAEKGWIRSDDSDDGRRELDPKFLKRTIRWFSPVKETPLCGHATHAAVKVLSTVFPKITRVSFESKYRGTLVADIERGHNHEDDLICLDFPENPNVEIPVDTPWLSALTKIFLGPNKSFEYVGYSETALYLMLILKNVDGEDPLETISKITPNFQELRQANVGGLLLDGFSVSIQGYPEVSEENKTNCYSRHFGPQIGINEDQVCGSMHTMVIPYWTKVLNLHGKFVYAYQASQRGGDLRCFVDNGRVKLCGRGRIVSEGKLLL